MIALEADWREAEDAACTDGLTDDERSRRCGIADALADRIAAAPARTLVGIGIKLRWAQQDDRLHEKKTPVAACVSTALDALAWQWLPMGEAVPEGHPDAALLALELEWFAAYASTSDPEIDKDEEEFDRRFRMADAIALRMSEMSACTVAGVAAKLR